MYWVQPAYISFHCVVLKVEQIAIKFWAKETQTVQIYEF